MPGSVDVQVRGLAEVVSALERMAGSVTTEMLQAMDDAGERVEDIMKSNVPSRSGSLADSISHEVEDLGDKVVVHIGPDDNRFDGRPVGRATELGRTPGGGFPNWNEIADRYGVSLGVAYAIAKRIQEQGSRGIGYGRETSALVEPIFREHGMQALMRIAGKFK